MHAMSREQVKNKRMITYMAKDRLLFRRCDLKFD
jgi:hypothetical protein